MQIAKGIKGIRKFMADNLDRETSGWHVLVDDEYYGFYPNTVREIFERITTTLGADRVTFLGSTGNGLTFAITSATVNA